MNKLSLLVLLATTVVHSATIPGDHEAETKCQNYRDAYTVCTLNQKLISVNENTENDVVSLSLNITSIAKDALRSLKTDHLIIDTVDPNAGYIRGHYVDIESGTFSNLSTLRTLELQHMYFKLSPNPFDFLADLNLTHFSATVHNLSRITTSTLSTINENLQNLTLALGKIRSIEPKSFERFSYLKHLDLSGNPVQNLLPGTFDGIDQLEVLDLSWCGLAAVPGDLMKNLQQLKILVLESNSIRTPSANDFLHMSGLLELDLSANSEITTLVPGTFDGLQELKRLRLSTCGLDIVKTNVFNKMLNLEILDLSSSHIETIEAYAFSGMTLKNLDLGNNKIHNILDNTFSGLDVIELDLGQNLITEVEQFAFSDIAVQTIVLEEDVADFMNNTSWGLEESVNIIKRF